MKSIQSKAVVVKMPGKSPKSSGPKAKPKAPAATELITTSVQTLIPIKHRDSLAAWFELYIKIEGGAKTTIAAKIGDLRLFLVYLDEAAGTDHPDQWTKSITKGFQSWLEKSKKQKPNTINRRLATLRTAAKWLEGQRSFLAGSPIEGIRDLEEDEPDWQGLTDLQVTRLKSAAEQLVAMKKRKNQRPKRDYAFFIVLLRTGLRCSELLNLDLSDYQGKHLVNIRRKGKKRTRQKLVVTEAREALDAYIATERGKKPGPLFLSNLDLRWSRSKAHDALKSIERQANANLPEDQQFEFSAHIERHTYLRKLTETKGIQYAKQESGNTSDKHLWRYIQPSKAELEAAQEGMF